MPITTPFDPEEVAHLEKAGWEAYYARRWLRVLRLMVRLNRAQFHLGWLGAVAASIDIVRASVAFAPVDNDVPRARRHLRSFYARARRSAGIATDDEQLALLEINYWVVHRDLADARKAAPDHAGELEPMVSALARLHAALFDAPPESIRRSAELRAEAAATVDRITGNYSDDVAADWQAVENLLAQAYREVAPLGV